MEEAITAIQEAEQELAGKKEEQKTMLDELRGLEQELAGGADVKDQHHELKLTVRERLPFHTGTSPEHRHSWPSFQ